MWVNWHRIGLAAWIALQGGLCTISLPAAASAMGQAQTARALQATDSDGATVQSSNLTGAIEVAFDLRNVDPLAAQAQLQALKAQAETGLDSPAIALSTHYLAILGYHFAEYAQTEAMLDATLLEHGPRLTPGERGMLELWQGRLWQRLGDLERAQTRFEELQASFQGQALLADVSLSQSELAYTRGIFDESVAKGLEALRLYEAYGDIDGQIQAHKDLGISYQNIDDFETSLFHFEAAKALLSQSEDVFVAVVLSANMGITLQKLGQLEAAMEAYEWTHESAVVLNRPLTQAQSLLNIGTIYSNEFGDERRAIEYYQRSLDVSKANGLDYGVMLNHMNIGVALGGLGQVEEAVAAFDRAYAIAVELDRPNEMQHLLGQKAFVLANAGQYQAAYEASQSQKEIAETLFNENRDRTISDLRVQYETELAEQALALSEARNEKQSQRIRFLWVIIALLVGLIGTSVGFSLYRNRALGALYERNIELVDAFVGSKGRAYAQSDTELDPLKEVFDRLSVLIEKERLFKDGQLTLAMLARRVQSNEKYVSQAISSYANMHFSNFINHYRINEAKKLLQRSDETYGITDVMLECGFSHKSTFYTAFKKLTGMTPTQFKDVAQQENARATKRQRSMGFGNRPDPSSDPA